MWGGWGVGSGNQSTAPAGMEPKSAVLEADAPPLDMEAVSRGREKQTTEAVNRGREKQTTEAVNRGREKQTTEAVSRAERNRPWRW